ncbi:Argonaute family protein [Melia azedarach]|uniref:Argonaute family protein n=1 Tax=Melia azedarach TaxID=155640 RepID=A0ACC1YNI9_MELAZ|nr:Argonaute family protein [Melia azedarach]
MEQKLAMEPPSSSANIPLPSSKAITFPVRPGFGTERRRCIVRANHFMVQIANRDFCHYDVSITPKVTSKKINREVIAQLVHLYGSSYLDGRTPAYDDRKSLYTAGKERQFKVVIKLVSRPDLFTLQQFLRSLHLEAQQEIIQVLGVVLRVVPSAKYTVAGRSFFSSELGPVGELGNGVEYWRGYFQYLRQTQMGLSLNIEDQLVISLTGLFSAGNDCFTRDLDTFRALLVLFHLYARTGVTGGQYNQVLLHEMTAIRQACASLEEGYMPRVTFVVV